MEENNRMEIEVDDRVLSAAMGAIEDSAITKRDIADEER
jgi:hypothetical protein